MPATRVPRNNFPLQGKKFILTQSEDQCEKLEKMLFVEQATVIRIPAIEFELVKNLDPIRQALKSISQYDLLVITSRNSFSFFEKVLKQEKVVLPKKLKIAVIGDETKSFIESKGYKVDYVPDQPKNSNELAQFLKEHIDFNQKKVLFPKSSLSNSRLPQTLRKQGAWVDDIFLYETRSNPTVRNTFFSVLGQPIDWILFSSPSAVRSFFSFTSFEQVQAWIFDSGIKIGSIGETTTKAILEYHVPVSLQSPRPSSKILVDSIKDFEEYEQF